MKAAYILQHDHRQYRFRASDLSAAIEDATSFLRFKKVKRASLLQVNAEDKVLARRVGKAWRRNPLAVDQSV